MKLHCCKAFINLVVVIYFNTAGNDIFPFKNCIKCLVQSNIYSLPEFYFSGKNVTLLHNCIKCSVWRTIYSLPGRIPTAKFIHSDSNMYPITHSLNEVILFTRNFFIDRTDLSNVWLNCLVHITRWGCRNSLCTACCFFCTHWFRRLTFNTNFFSFNNLVVFVYY